MLNAPPYFPVCTVLWFRICFPVLPFWLSLFPHQPPDLLCVLKVCCHTDPISTWQSCFHTEHLNSVWINMVCSYLAIICVKCTSTSFLRLCPLTLSLPGIFQAVVHIFSREPSLRDYPVLLGAPLVCSSLVSCAFFSESLENKLKKSCPFSIFFT